MAFLVQSRAAVTQSAKLGTGSVGQMKKGSKPTSIDEYIGQFPTEVREVLTELRDLVRATAPEVTERISYGIPTFDLNGRSLVYIAGWRKYVSVYPATAAVRRALGEELEPHLSGRGTLRFPLTTPLPSDLIRRVVEARVRVSCPQPAFRWRPR